MKISLTFTQMGPTPWGPALQKQARGPPSRGRAVRCVPDLRQCLKRKRFVSATTGWGFLAPDMEVFSFAGIFSSKIGDDWDDKSWSVKELLIPALPCIYIYINDTYYYSIYTRSSWYLANPVYIYIYWMRISIIITVIMIGQPPNGYVQTNEDVKATNLGDGEHRSI